VNFFHLEAAQDFLRTKCLTCSEILQQLRGLQKSKVKSFVVVERSKKGTHRGLTSFEEPRPPVVPCLRVRCEGAEVETYTIRYRDTLFLVERRSSALTGVARRASLLVRR
jgi:hypothetical protein